MRETKKKASAEKVQLERDSHSLKHNVSFNMHIDPSSCVPRLQDHPMTLRPVCV